MFLFTIETLLLIQLYKAMLLSNQVISEIFNLMFTKSHFELGPTYTTTYGLWTFRHFADKIRTSNTFSALTTKTESLSHVRVILYRSFVGQVE